MASQQWSLTVSDKRIMKDDIVPKGLTKHVVAQQITHDYILELYEKSKKLKGKNKRKANKCGTFKQLLKKNKSFNYFLFIGI